MDIIKFGNPDERTVSQLTRCLEAEEGSKGVLCADAHVGYSMPIGGVAAYRDHVSPSGVGYDIGCGNYAVKTDLLGADMGQIHLVMDEIVKVISFGMGRNNEEKIADHPIFDRIARSPIPQQRAMLQMARNQLGTVGSGNHYVDLFEDRADGSVWVGVHFGSRGFGHKTASGFLALAEGKEWSSKVGEDMDAPPTLIPLPTPLGGDYMQAMTIAGEYAYAGREWVVNRVLQILGTRPLKHVHNHHNFAWNELHNDELFCVVRKGATPARPGQQGFIGGSMGEDAVIVEGVDSDMSKLSLYSTVHGAGRAMGRREAAGKSKISKTWQCLNYRNCNYVTAIQNHSRGHGNSLPICPSCGSKLNKHEVSTLVRPGKINWEQTQAEIRALGIELRGGGAEEAPLAYKRLPEVLEYHAGTIKILHHLRPIGVAMAGADVEDPFRD